MVFIVTKEKKSGTIEALIITKNGSYRVYRAENDRELKHFEGGLLFNSVEGVLRFAEKIKNGTRV